MEDFFQREAQPLEVPVCDFLAYVLHATPDQQETGRKYANANGNTVYTIRFSINRLQLSGRFSLCPFFNRQIATPVEDLDQKLVPNLVR